MVLFFRPIEMRAINGDELGSFFPRKDFCGAKIPKYAVIIKSVLVDVTTVDHATT